MRFKTLDEWLAWQETLHPSAIDLGLERVRAVFEALHVPPFACPVITVAGTNGKGSCVAMLDAILRAAGYRTGVYTSPHLFRYNERVVLSGEQVEDAGLCAAFERVDQARGDISLTYFEFGTLAALDIFARRPLDAVILEVGLGGRLDAVNIIAADVALLTTIGIDHVDWLGPDRESIGREKAGVMRPGRPAVCVDRSPPESVNAMASTLAAPLQIAGRDFGYQRDAHDWSWWGVHGQRRALPMPALQGDFQLDNAAAVLAVLACLEHRLPVGQDAVRHGLVEARLPGRCQFMPGSVEWLFDVAHNPQAAAALAGMLMQRRCSGRTHAVLAMFADKDAEGFFNNLAAQVDVWHLAGLAGARGQGAERLRERLMAVGNADIATCNDDVATACTSAAAAARAGDRILVTGSFLTVAEAFAASQFH